MESTQRGTTFRNRTGMILGFCLCFMAVAMPSLADTQWSVGFSGGSRGIDGFNLSIGEYYHVPEREVVVLHERGIYEEELPVVFYLAQRAHVDPDYVVDLRLWGMSWLDITLYLGLSPEIFYMPVVVHGYGPPHGPAYGYYHNRPRGAWRRADFRDQDIINQVNLRFMSEHHRYAPGKIMQYRSEGRSFTDIDRSLGQLNKGNHRNLKLDETARHADRQPPSRVPMTRQDQQYRSITRPDHNGQGMTRQNQQVRNMTSQNQPTKTMTRADGNARPMNTPGQQVGNMSRQSQSSGGMRTPDERRNTIGEHQQARTMTRRD